MGMACLWITYAQGYPHPVGNHIGWSAITLRHGYIGAFSRPHGRAWGSTSD